MENWLLEFNCFESLYVVCWIFFSKLIYLKGNFLFLFSKIHSMLLFKVSEFLSAIPFFKKKKLTRKTISREEIWNLVLLPLHFRARLFKVNRKFVINQNPLVFSKKINFQPKFQDSLLIFVNRIIYNLFIYFFPLFTGLKTKGKACQLFMHFIFFTSWI